ncbi:MAG: hypothetical protein WCD00_02195 [Desulfuromonadaceae bacterium]
MKRKRESRQDPSYVAAMLGDDGFPDGFYHHTLLRTSVFTQYNHAVAADVPSRLFWHVLWYIYMCTLEAEGVVKTTVGTAQRKSGQFTNTSSRSLSPFGGIQPVPDRYRIKPEFNHPGIRVPQYA